MQTKETPTLGSISASCTKEAVETDSNPVPSQEAGLLDLLRKAEGDAYALAHGYDIGGQTERACGLVARICDTATDASGLARPAEPHGVPPAK